MDKLFHIFKINLQESDLIQSKPIDPHKHDFEELLIGIKGLLEHFIDFESNSFQAPFISFVTKGKTHRVIPKSINNECEIWGIRFKSEFIPESTFHFYTMFHNNATMTMEPGYCFDRINAICTMMKAEYDQEFCNYAIIKQMLSLLFTMIEAQHQNSSQYSKTHQTTFTNFLSLLEENYHRPLGVEFYAEKLFMTSRNLNRICQTILEQSVSEIIETRKLIEAKNLLLTTEKTISEIGYELGFNEKSYFTNVFKKKSGITPTEFREEMKKILIV